jgi:hypothetical protein
VGKRLKKSYVGTYIASNYLLKHNQLNRAKVAGALKVKWERVLQELIDQVIDLMPVGWLQCGRQRASILGIQGQSNGFHLIVCIVG